MEGKAVAMDAGQLQDAYERLDAADLFIFKCQGIHDAHGLVCAYGLSKAIEIVSGKEASDGQ